MLGIEKVAGVVEVAESVSSATIFEAFDFLPLIVYQPGRLDILLELFRGQHKRHHGRHGPRGSFEEPVPTVAPPDRRTNEQESGVQEQGRDGASEIARECRCAVEACRDLERTQQDGVQSGGGRGEHDAAEEGVTVCKGRQESHNGLPRGIVLEQDAGFFVPPTETVERGYASDVTFQKLENRLGRTSSQLI